MNTEWTQDDFETMGWHDNTVHAIRLRNPDEGFDYDLVLDIDYILEWTLDPEKHYLFTVAPATLTFSKVDKLLIEIGLTYREALEIDGIERREITTETQREHGLRNYCWTISLHSLPFSGRKNRISFEACGFQQVLTKPPVTIPQQGLDDGGR